MKIEYLQQIIMSLDDSFRVMVEEQKDKVDTIPIKSVEICLATKEVILKI